MRRAGQGLPALLLILSLPALAADRSPPAKQPAPGAAAPAARSKVHGEAPSLPPPTHPSERALADTLKAKRYEFCHEAKYPLTEDEVRWCALLPPATDARAARCADFARACEAGATANLVPPSKPINLRLPSFGGIGRVVFYTLIAAMVGGFLFLLARSLVGRRRAAPNADEGEATRTDQVAGRAEQAAVIERDVNRLLARARAAASAGDHLAAVGDLHAALLRRLEGDGHIRVHRSATNGDYVRELRSRAPVLAAPVGEVTGAVESIQFGVTPAGHLYQALLERVTALLEASTRVVAALAFFALAIVGSSCDTTRSDWRDSPSGSAAVSAFLTASGVETRERLRPLAELDSAREVAEAHDRAERETKGEDTSESKDDGADAKANASLLPPPPRTLVILPDAQVGDADWAAVKAAAEKRALTIVVAGPRRLPAWIPAELVGDGAAGPVHITPAFERWRDPRQDEGPQKEAQARQRADLQLQGAIPTGGWVNVGKPTPHEVFLRRGGKPYAVEMTVATSESPDGIRVVILADGQLFRNASLAVADNGAILQVLMSSLLVPVQIVTQETGLVATTPLDSVARGRLAPFMLQLCAFLILFFVLRGAAFGKLMDRHVIRRRRFAEHIEALGLQYARARAGRHAATAYAMWTVERLRERLRGDRGLGELATATAARTGKPLGDVARLLFQAHQDQAADAEPRTRAVAEESLQTIRELAALVAPGSGRTTTTHKKPGETKS